MKKFNLKMLMIASLIATTKPLFASEDLLSSLSLETEGYSTNPNAWMHDKTLSGLPLIDLTTTSKSDAADFLTKLYNTNGIYWHYQIEIAKELAELGEEYIQQAADFLTDLMNSVIFAEEKATLRMQLKAAESLGSLGEPYTQQAADFLISLSEKLDGIDKGYVIRIISSFGEKYKQQATDHLVRMVDEATKEDAQTYIFLAGRLFEKYEDASITIFKKIIKNLKYSHEDRRLAILNLLFQVSASLDAKSWAKNDGCAPFDKTAFMDIVYSIAKDPELDCKGRILIAKELLSFRGEDYIQEAIRIIGYSFNPEIMFSVITDILNTFEDKQQGSKILRSVVDNHFIPMVDTLMPHIALVAAEILDAVDYYLGDSTYQYQQAVWLRKNYAHVDGRELSEYESFAKSLFEEMNPDVQARVLKSEADASK